MEQIALIYGSVFVYWSDILLVMAGMVAIFVYLALYLRQEGSAAAGIVSVPLCAAFSLLLARFVHWYCRTDSYSSLTAALMDHSSGGYALVGVFAGCALAALLLRLVKLSDDLPRMLDCMAVAGCAGIAVGRLSCFFNTADRGMVVTSFRGLPWAWTVVNPVSGAEELRLATFFLQALVAAVLFLALLVFWLREDRQPAARQGDTCLIFLLCYGASQVLLDSTRYDSLYFRSNGFVSIVQVLGACGLGLAAIVFSVRLVRSRGWKKWYLVLWIGLAGLIGLGGFMEYFVQRYSHKVVTGYSIMAAALAGIIALTLVIRALAVSGERRMQMQTLWQESSYGNDECK
ncbi:MAG: prolipoprotein diacylglyceryl transferase [Oscillospiraceae bacterium]|nr:prolipoprotein diacylglyceryl transferase [Oscillospiraceae bacterium]